MADSLRSQSDITLVMLVGMVRKSFLLMAVFIVALSGCGSSKKTSSAAGTTSSTTTSSTAAATSSSITSTTKPGPPTTPAGTIKILPSSVTVQGHFESVDKAAKIGTLNVTCPGNLAGKYKVNLANADFEYETNPAHPESGRVQSETFDTWAANQSSDDWIVDQESSITSVSSSSAPQGRSIC